MMTETSEITITLSGIQRERLVSLLNLALHAASGQGPSTGIEAAFATTEIMVLIQRAEDIVASTETDNG